MPIEIHQSSILIIILPLIGGFIIPGISLICERKNYSQIRDYLVFGIIFTTFIMVINTAYSTWGEVYVYPVGGWNPPLGITIVIDGLGVYLSLIVAFISLIVFFYSLYYLKNKNRLSQFYTLMLFLVAGMFGVVFAGDIFNLYVFFEIMSISSYALIALYHTKDSIEGALKYLIIGSLGTTFILLGIVLLYALTGTLNLADLIVRLARVTGDDYSVLSIMAVGSLIMGFGMKVGIIPFHAWLPDAYQSAPIPVTTIMAGGTGIVGIGALVRTVILLFGFDLIGSHLLILGILSMIGGALLALNQNDLKRMLAYSSISQIGYVILGLGIATPWGINGGLYHLLNKAIFKSLLFLVIGIIIYKTGTSDMNKLSGLNKKMPFITGSFVIGSLALIGIPPFNGFISKIGIIFAGFEANYPVYSVIASFSAALTLTYIIKAFISVFLGKQSPVVQKATYKSPYFLMIPVIVLIIFCFILGIYPDIGYSIAEFGGEVIINPYEYVEAVFPGN